MKNQIHYVYVTTNLINGKQYVGDHTINDKSLYYIGSGKIIECAIKKYGEKNFFKEILEWFDTRKEAFVAQEKYIKLFNTLTPNGYNISPTGGMNENGGLHSEESKEKNRKSHLGKPVWSKGMKFSESHRKNLSESRRINKCAIGENNGMHGKKHTKESRKKMSLKRLGKKDSQETKFKKSIAAKGSNNPMYEKSVFDIWVEKYGQKEAEERNKKMLDNRKREYNNRKIKICPHCGVSGKGSGIIRYHFNNCKLKKETN